MMDDPLLDEAASIADRRPATSDSESDGLRLIDQLVRVFGAHADDSPSPEAPFLFTWGTLEVKRPLASGAFGEVFAAWDPTLRREVALKLRTPEVGALRWLDEARNVARVRHPHVLTVYGADVLEGRAGIWTELIAGKTLEQELETNGPFSSNETLRIGRDIASALAAVHAAGLVHGDVKTDNIMLEDGDSPRRAVLVDFGTADEMLEDGHVPPYLVGTPLTMAPEVLDGRPATGSSDVYGLGVTLFRLLTGRYPVQAETLEGLREAHAGGTRAALRSIAPNVSPRLARVIERALEPTPAKRWPSAKAFRAAIEDVADPTRRIRARAAAIGAGVAALAAVIVLVVLASRPGSGPISRSSLSRPTIPNLFHESWRRPGEAGANGGLAYRAAVLDANGDGFDDLVAAEARWKRSAPLQLGRVLVFPGSKNGLSRDSTATMSAVDAGSVMGTNLASAGDVDADGFEDLLVTQEILPDLIGRVELHAGSPHGPRTEASWSVLGSTRDSGLGRSMTAAGDVNGDGFGDVIVGELRAAEPLVEEGVVRLYFGSKAGLSQQPVWVTRGGQERMELGSLMSAVGDVNGDGHDDVLVGAQFFDGAAGVECGLARLYYGDDKGASTAPAWSQEGAGTDFLFGCFTGGAGDVNGDGFDDMLISERQYSDDGRPERGRVLIFHGAHNGPSTAPDWEVRGPVAYAHLGFCAIGMGDIDGDGFDDVAVGAEQYTQGAQKHLGLVEVYRGGRTGCERRAAWRIVGNRDDAHLGTFVSPGDFNGDGVPDFVATAPMWGDAVPERGLLLAFLGRRR